MNKIIGGLISVSTPIYLPKFNVNIPVMRGTENTAEFMADKAGTFAFRCGVPCGPGHGSMLGKLVVNG